MITIPLLSGSINAHQSFSMQLGNNFLDFELDFLSYLEYPAWSLSIYRDGSPLALGAMLEPGSDILKNYNARIGSFVFVGEMVTLDNLGVANSLVWTP